jgi:hypothetical protein
VKLILATGSGGDERLEDLSQIHIYENTWSIYPLFLFSNTFDGKLELSNDKSFIGDYYETSLK